MEIFPTMILTGSAFDACLSLIFSQTIHKFGIYKQNDFSLAQEWIHEFLPSILLHEQLNFFFCREYCTFYMRCAPWFFGTKTKFEKKFYTKSAEPTKSTAIHLKRWIKAVGMICIRILLFGNFGSPFRVTHSRPPIAAR